VALDGSYTGLIASIGDLLNRGDVSTVAADWVVMCTAEINRRLTKDGPVRQQFVRSDATLNSEYTALPSDFIAPRTLYLGTLTDVPPLRYCKPEVIVDYKQRYSDLTGDPRVWSVVGGAIQLWPFGAGASYSGEMTYWAKLTPPTSLATNWMLTDHPDAYLYGSAIHSAPYLKKDDRMPMWTAAFGAIIQDIVDMNRVTEFAADLEVQLVDQLV